MPRSAPQVPPIPDYPPCSHDKQKVSKPSFTFLLKRPEKSSREDFPLPVAPGIRQLQLAYFLWMPVCIKRALSSIKDEGSLVSWYHLHSQKTHVSCLGVHLAIHATNRRNASESPIECIGTFAPLIKTSHATSTFVTIHDSITRCANVHHPVTAYLDICTPSFRCAAPGCIRHERPHAPLTNRRLSVFAKT